MTVTSSLEVKHALVLRDSEIKNLWQVLEEGFSSVTASARCADKLRRPFATVDELLNYPNSRSKCIQQLSIAARSRGSQADLQLKGEWEHPTATVEIEDEETKALQIRDKLADILDGMKPWYSFAANANFVLVRILSYVLAVALLAVWIFPKTEQNSFSVSASFAVLSVAGAFGTMWIFVRVGKHFFPAISFSIGQGVERHNFGEKVRWVVVAFVISVLTSTVGYIVHSM